MVRTKKSIPVLAFANNCRWDMWHIILTWVFSLSCTVYHWHRNFIVLYGVGACESDRTAVSTSVRAIPSDMQSKGQGHGSGAAWTATGMGRAPRRCITWDSLPTMMLTSSTVGVRRGGRLAGLSFSAQILTMLGTGIQTKCPGPGDRV